MNAKKRSAIGAWLVLQTLLAHAQTPDTDALERAQRDADNPMRLIIEAGKIKAKGKSDADAKTDLKADNKGDARPEDRPAGERPPARAAAAKAPAPEPAHVPTPEETRAAALASVRGLAAAAPADAADPPAAAASAVTLPIAPGSAQEMPPAKAAEAARESVSATATLDAGASPTPPAAAIQTTASETAASETATNETTPTAPAPAASMPGELVSTASAGTPLRAAPDVTDARPPVATPVVSQSEPTRVALAVAPLVPRAPPVALELVSSVQPDLPDRVRRRLRRDGEVVLVFKVNTDGTVVDLNVQSSTDSALDEFAVEAVRQWRYKPILEARTHRLQLVFRRE